MKPLYIVQFGPDSRHLFETKVFKVHKEAIDFIMTLDGKAYQLDRYLSEKELVKTIRENIV